MTDRAEVIDDRSVRLNIVAPGIPYQPDKCERLIAYPERPVNVVKLSVLNHHPRDDLISFEEKEHVYTIRDSPHAKNPTSVTTLVHKYFKEFDANAIVDKMMKGKNWRNSKYFGMSKEAIIAGWSANGSDASKLGTDMHAQIEDYFDYVFPTERSKEYNMFLKFWSDFSVKYPTYKPYRTEWIVYDTIKNISGSIDFVLSDGTNYMILDWKRCKEIKLENRYDNGLHPFTHLPDCNYSHYTLQLNFYRHMLETIYNKPVIFMMLVVFHPNQSDYVCVPVNRTDVTVAWNAITP